MSAIAQCVKKKKKKNALSVSFFYGSDLNTSTQKELTCGLLRGEPRETVRVFSFHERVSNHVWLKEREDLTPFLFSTRVSLVACGDILKKKKKRRRRRKKEKKSQTDPRSDRSLFCCAWSEWTSLSSSPSHSDQLQLSSNTQTKE